MNVPSHQYYFNLPSVQKRLIKLSKGAIQKCLFINDLEELLIDYPETIEEQQKVVASLVEIDAQIQRNKDMCHKLRLNDTTTSCFSMKGEIRHENIVA